ncbi:MAG TPA: hypothetical protein VN380_14405 [Thermoanaerobaculia bacterium]|jgi:hypothetical protein|nr:hypothetical protein [Thermoanaerobaculia bacterium]
MTEDQRDRPENPHLFAFGDRVELVIHQRPPAVLFPTSAGQSHTTSDDDHRLPRSSAAGFARLYDEEVPSLDAQGGDVRAGAKELVARVHHQFVREWNQLAGRGGVDGFSLRDGSVKMHGHDDLLSRVWHSRTSGRD